MYHRLSRHSVVVVRATTASIPRGRSLATDTTSRSVPDCGAAAATGPVPPAAPASTPPRRLRVVTSSTTDPFFNLATEEWLFRSFAEDEAILYLWRNEPTVFIGRNQNAWKECFVQRMEDERVHLVRRYSGGGAVYQDLGNTCWTFLSSRAVYNNKINTQVVIDSLKRFGVQAVASGRNDILVDSLKVSGSAYKLAGSRACHHGTLLLNVNIENLGRYLNPNKEKLKSKGVASVVARVTNLSQMVPSISHDGVSSALIQSFLDHHKRAADDPSVHIEELQHVQLEHIPELEQSYKELLDWKWRFGETPKFEHSLETRFDWGIMDVNINAEHGLIHTIKIFSDTLYPDMIDVLTKKLTGVPYSAKGISDAIDEAIGEFYGQPVEEHLEQFKQWLVKQL